MWVEGCRKSEGKRGDDEEDEELHDGNTIAKDSNGEMFQ